MKSADRKWLEILNSLNPGDKLVVEWTKSENGPGRIVSSLYCEHADIKVTVPGEHLH